MSTDAAVLSIRVHLAAVNERRIQAAAGLDVAKAALNDLLGLPLDSSHRLTTLLEPLDLPELALNALEKDASANTPEARQSRLSVLIEESKADAARAAFRPQVNFHAAVEADRQQVFTRGGTNWLAAIAVRWNLFHGFGDRARVAESIQLVERAGLEQQQVDSAVRLQVRRAYAGLRAAQQRIEVSRAAVAEAEESLRITQNRYEAGMTNVTDLLLNETAVLESRTRYLAAVHDQRVAATLLELAAGRLSADSEVLN